MTAGTPEGRDFVRTDEGGAARARAIEAALRAVPKTTESACGYPGCCDVKVPDYEAMAATVATFADAERPGAHLVERGDAGAWTADAVARLFHETYERLAPDFGYETRKASAVPWEQVPERNRALMVAVAGTVLAALSNVAPARERSERAPEADAEASAARPPEEVARLITIGVKDEHERATLREAIVAALAAARQEAETAEKQRQLYEDLCAARDDKIRAMGEEMDEEVERLRAALGAAQQTAAKVCEGFDQGVFVRDVSKDAAAGWALRLVPYMQALGALARLGERDPDSPDAALAASPTPPPPLER